jgi:hypothetical protein
MNRLEEEIGYEVSHNRIGEYVMYHRTEVETVNSKQGVQATHSCWGRLYSADTAIDQYITGSATFAGCG